MRQKATLAFLAASSIAYLVVVIWWLVTASTSPSLSELLWVLVVVPVPVLAGLYLMWKRPDNPIGALLATSSVATFVLLTIVEIPTLRAFEVSGTQEWMWWPMWFSEVATQVGVVLTIALLVLLPDGHFRYPRDRRLVRWSWVIVAFPTLSLITNETVISHDLSFPGIDAVPSPLVVESLLPYGSFFAGLPTAGYLLVLVGLWMLVARYRAASNRERKQVRWVLYGGTLGIGIAMAPFLLAATGAIAPLQHTLASLLYTLPILLFPLSIVVAVVEPPWVDIDIVIRKSFVYGALSFVILLLYIGVAAAFGVAAAGTRLNIELAVTLTVVVAVLFQPARQRLQVVADRWVFGARPSGYQTVTEFGETIEQASDPTELLPRLVETLKQSLRLQWVSVALDDGTSSEAGTAAGTPVLTVPIGIGSEDIGSIECGPKVSGSISDDERHLVQTLAAQVGLAVMNARLAGRIVNAAEAERRRIERNIHDGAQQELVALVARLGMARSQAAHGGLAPEAIEELQAEARQILSDLRALAQGIHPSVLSDGGILEAIEERCSHLPISVSLQAPESLRTTRFSDDVEGAAYFFVTEALANVLKHADASHVEVSLDSNGRSIELAVADDGRGFDPKDSRQRGLIGLSDRIRALGGTMTITSRPQSGTTVRAHLPVGTT